MNNAMVGEIQKIFRISTMSDLRNQSEREVDPILHLELFWHDFCCSLLQHAYGHHGQGRRIQ